MNLSEYLKTSGVTKAELARRIGVTPPLIWQWLNDHRRVAAEKVLPIEQATEGKVTRHELRPDLYPIEPAPKRLHAVQAR